MRAFFTTFTLSTLLLASARAVEPEAVVPHVAASTDSQVHRNPRADLRVSNAKRLAMGRPLRRPKQIRDAQLKTKVGLGQNDQPTINANAQPVANGDPCTDAIIEVRNGDDESFIGYMGATLDNSGVFNSVVTFNNDPNILTICYYGLQDGPTDVLDTSSLGNSTVPYLGAIVGDAYTPALSSGDGDYVYLGLVAETPRVSTPTPDPDSTGNSHNEATGHMQAYESGIWYYSGSGQTAAFWNDPSNNEQQLEFGRLVNGGEFIASTSLDHLGGSGVAVTSVTLRFLQTP